MQFTYSAPRADMPMMEYSVVCKSASITQSYFAEGGSEDGWASCLRLCSLIAGMVLKDSSGWICMFSIEITLLPFPSLSLLVSLSSLLFTSPLLPSTPSFVTLLFYSCSPALFSCLFSPLP